MDSSPTGHGSFRENRRRLAAALPAGSIAVIATGRFPQSCGADSAAPWPDFFYLTGQRSPQMALIIESNQDRAARMILFVAARDPRSEVWDGPVGDERHEFTDVRPIGEFESVLRALGFQADAVFVFSPENPFAPQNDHGLAGLCHRLLPLHRIERLAPLLGRLRAEKKPPEIDNIRAANALAANAFRRAIGFVRPGVRGFEVKAEFLHEITRHGSAGFCCPPIVAAGGESLALHWRGDHRPWSGGESALLDFTVEWNGTCADIARCLPVGGAFAPRQRAVHDAVERVLCQAMTSLRPGRLLSDCQRETELAIQHELLRLGLLKSADAPNPSVVSPALRGFFMHEAFHHIGLEVHDPVPAGLPLAAGHVLAVEPGIYLHAEGFGIRLENNVLITENGAENLTASLPLAAEEIEELLQL